MVVFLDDILIFEDRGRAHRTPEASAIDLEEEKTLCQVVQVQILDEGAEISRKRSISRWNFSRC